MVFISSPVSVEIAREHPCVSIDIEEKAPEISVEFGEVNVYGAETYNGEYVVTPEAYRATILPTSGKRMREDVNVKEIPYFAVSNPQGGKTVSIATDQIIVLNGGV